MTRDHGILYSAPMVRAICAGDKVETRRLIGSPLKRARPGDRFWVREAFRAMSCFDHLPPIRLRDDALIGFEADRDAKKRADGKLRPGIFLPRKFARITGTITEVRTEPLRDLTDQCALREGVRHFQMERKNHISIAPRAAFRLLWNSLHTAESTRWWDNPDVIVICFEVD